MSASDRYARIREHTMGSAGNEEAVTVNTRALIDKVLARYSGEWTTLRELIQNAADAKASKVSIRFETRPSATVPLPSSQDPSEHLKHTLLHHTLKTLVVTNDGELFKESDWQRLKRIAEGNPDETKIGAFGVGFYSVFAECEEPFVSSGNQSMAFFWKNDSLFTRRGQLPDDQASEGTTFLLDYRGEASPVPPLIGLCQFLATSLTFVGLECLELFIDDWKIIELKKKLSPGTSVKIPSDVNPKTRDGLMKITDVKYQNAQVDAIWMNVVGWNRRPLNVSNNSASQQHSGDAGGISLRSFFGRFTSHATNSVVRKAQRDEDALQEAIAEDLLGFSRATVFLRMSTVDVKTFVSNQLRQELERATKKPPPSKTHIAILTSSYDESSASMATVSGNSSKKANEIFASVLPTKNGRIFIGFPTAQTTGLLAHISAPSVIPTVERENIDLNARYVRDWNMEMLRVAGIACRIAYTGEMSELKIKLERAMIASGHKSVTKVNIEAIMPVAIHTLQQYNYAESTPSSKVGQYIEEAFWTCNQNASIDILSTRGVLPSHKVRVATEDLSFVEGIPVVPDDLMSKANEFLTKIREYGLLSDITTSDIKRELEAQALTETQVYELVKWACKKVSQGSLDAAVIQTLFDGTVATISEEFVSTSASPVLPLGDITSFVNTAKIPPEMPTPPQTIPFRLTRGLSPAQLQSIGWAELQIVPWLRWIIESNGRGFAPSQSLTETPAVACQVLPVISKAWDGLSQGSKGIVTDLLMSRTVIPTKLGMRRPPQAYFASVKLFDDLPTITNLQGVKEKFLSALGVRKTVELNVVFDRLMAKSSGSVTEEGKWSHVDLIKYLLSVKDDIPAEDIKRLRQTPICPAAHASGEQETKNKLYRLSELYEPDEAIKRLSLPILQWPGSYRAASAEGRFLRSLGLQAFPDVPALVGILAKAPSGSELQQSTITYWIVNAYQNGYNKYPVQTIDVAFLPVQPFPGEGNNLVAKPSQCYANPKSAVLGFRTLREDLQAHYTTFGVALDPPIDTCADRLIKGPPIDYTSARTLFGYFAGRLGEISPNGNICERLSTARVVPIVSSKTSEKTRNLHYTTPRACFLGDSQSYGEIFDFVDFGHEANTFLLRVGSKHEPSATEIAGMVVRQPGRLLDSLGSDKYLQTLRKLAENAAALKKDKELWQQLKTSSCLLAEKLVQVSANGQAQVDDEDAIIKEYSLVRAPEMVLVDDFVTYRIFQDRLLAAPQEEVLENLYSALDTPWLSRLVEDDQRMGPILRDQTSAQRLQALLVERCRLFLYDHAADAIRHDAKWIEQNMNVKATEFLQINRKLKGYNLQFRENRTAALHRETRRDATLFVTARYDLYEVSRAIMSLLLKRPRQQDFLALETILESDLRRLKTKGYNVDRILRQRAAESRIAEDQKRKREEEQQRILEAEKATRPPEVLPPNPTPSGQAAQPQLRAPDSPERAPSMPGSFADSPEQQQLVGAGSSGRGKRSTELFSSITRHLGLQTGGRMGQHMQNMLGHGSAPEMPPPYQPQDPNGGRALAPGTERVSSPRDLALNLQSAIQATRPYNSNSLFSPPETREIKETPSYCDSKPGHDLRFVSELHQGLKLYLPHTHPELQTFVRTHGETLESFINTLAQAANIFELSPQTINIFHDEQGASIAFNSNGSIFCNLRYFMQLHSPQMATRQGQIEAMVYWYVTLCHELAHNLVAEHDSRHSFYTESFVGHFFSRVLMWSAGMMSATPGVVGVDEGPSRIGWSVGG